MKIQPTPIASAVALALMSTVLAARAQQAAPAPAAAASQAAGDDVQTITVTGIRASLQQSLTQKRNAESHVEVISAEDIGKMPDKNVADSLQRVPGVTISSAGANEGGFDENDRVSMRGTNPSLTQTLVNGHNVAAGDWFVLNQTGTVGRSVSYTLLPSELVSRVVVHKTSEAQLVEGGVAGSVDIITRKPMEFRKPFTAEVSAGLVYAQLPGKTDPQFSGLLNWKGDTVGVMVQLFSETRHLRRDGQELLGYEQIAPGSAVATAHPDLANVWYPTMIGSALFEQERKRQGGLIDFEIKPTNNLTLDANAFVSHLDASNYNRNYLLWNTHFINKGAGQAPDAGYVVQNGTLTSANFSPVAGTQYGVYDQISRPDESADAKFLDLDADWRVSEVLRFKAKAGVSRGEGKTPTQDVAEWNTGIGTGGGWQLNGTNSAANWNLGNATTNTNANDTLSWIFGDQNIDVVDKENWGQIDGEYSFDNGVLSSLQFGLRAEKHDRDSGGVIGQGPKCSNGDAFNWAAATFNCPVASTSPFNPANYPQGFSQYPSNFGQGLGGSFPTNIWYFSPGQLAAFDATYSNRDPVTREDWNSEFGLSERTSAGYLQANFQGTGWSGNVGVRLVQTKEHVVTNEAADATAPGAHTQSAFGSFVPLVTDHTYNDVLPSANLRFDITHDLVARFAASKTMTRPDYSALAGFLSLSPPAVAGGTGSGSGGNPDLKPIRSNNFDADLEWYFAPRSLVSAGLFYMDLTSYVGYGQVTKSYMTYSSQDPQGTLVPYTLTVPVNSSGTVKGLELAYEMPIGSNFGVSANYTYADGKETGGNRLVGTSKNTYNLSGYYEDDHFNARLSYNYRSDFYSGLDRNTAFSQAAVANLAATLGYKVNEMLNVTLDLQNLNNPTLKYFALNEDQPRSIYRSGRQYYLNAHFKF
jgi:iron complex outermembrane receptor protein